MQEVEGANIFDLVESGSHQRLRRLLEENLGSVSKEAIASALRHQGTTFESLLARAEMAKEQGDSSFFSASGEPARFPGPTASSSRRGGARSGSGSGSGSTDDWESEVTTSACEGSGRTSASTSASGGGGQGSGSGSGGGGGSSGTSEVESSGASRGAARTLARPHQKPLPPLGPAAFSMGQGGKPLKTAAGAAAAAASAEAAASTEGGTKGVRLGGIPRTRGGGGAGSVTSDAKKSWESEAARSFDCGSEASGDSGSGGAGKASMVNIDRDLQSKINAFTNTQKVRPRLFFFFFLLCIARRFGSIVH